MVVDSVLLPFDVQKAAGTLQENLTSVLPDLKQPDKGIIRSQPPKVNNQPLLTNYLCIFTETFVHILKKNVYSE